MGIYPEKGVYTHIFHGSATAMRCGFRCQLPQIKPQMEKIFQRGAQVLESMFNGEEYTLGSFSVTDVVVGYALTRA